MIWSVSPSGRRSCPSRRRTGCSYASAHDAIGRRRGSHLGTRRADDRHRKPDVYDDAVRLLTDPQALAERDDRPLLTSGFVVDLCAQRVAGGTGNRRVLCLGTLDLQGRQPNTYQQLATASLGRESTGGRWDHVQRPRPLPHHSEPVRELDMTTWWAGLPPAPAAEPH